MQPPTVREVIQRLKREGYVLVRVRGDHRHYRKGSRLVTVAGKMGEPMKRGTWASVREQAGW